MLIELLAVSGQVGHHEAPVGALGSVLDPGDHPAFAFPATGAVDELGEVALLQPDLGEARFSQRHGGPREGNQPGVLGQPEEVANTVALAPAHQPPAAEARIGPHHDAHPGPGPTQAGQQKLQDRPGVLPRVDIGRPQIGDWQVIASEHIQRRKVIPVVMAVEEAPLLMTVHRVVGGVEVKNYLRRSPLEAGAPPPPSARTDDPPDATAAHRHSLSPRHRQNPPPHGARDRLERKTAQRYNPSPPRSRVRFFLTN